MTDTSREAVEKMAADFEKEGRHAELAGAMDDVDHVEWCMWMRNAGALLRALLAERDAAYERGAADMRERAAAAAQMALGGRAHTYASENADIYRAQDHALHQASATIRALPLVQP
jgi:hypothetical protein